MCEYLRLSYNVGEYSRSLKRATLDWTLEAVEDISLHVKVEIFGSILTSFDSSTPLLNNLFVIRQKLFRRKVSFIEEVERLKEGISL
jgi:hypothetical protein